MPDFRSQPKTATLTERLRYMPSSLNDACRTMDEAAARIEELEAWQRARLEMSDMDGARIVKLERALTWIANSPSAHPANMVKVAEEGLSHD